MKALWFATACAVALNLSPAQAQENPVTPDAVVRDYVALVYTNYWDAHRDAQALQRAVDTLLSHPDEAHLTQAREAWLAARESYGQTEAFRFYEGPIDFADPNGTEGPEARLNSWPLNEAYIDYVTGNENAGIVQDSTVEISKASLAAKNQATDEADVATGYHAIEFLLWGQDLSLDGPGSRPASDYADTPQNARRRSYLKAVTDLLVDDLAFLVKSWAPGEDNYARRFVTRQTEESLGDILSALATLSGFELASERLATALDSGDQEDEHSCFSDNTHRDFIMNAQGIANVYFGRYGEETGVSLHDLIEIKDAALAQKIQRQLEETKRLLTALPHPIDREVLAAPVESKGRLMAEKAVASLQTQADLFKEAGKALGVSVGIVSD